MMTKSVVGIIAALSVGVMGGALLGHQYLREEVEQLRAEHEDSLKLAAEAQETVAASERRAERLVQRNAHLEERLERLHTTLADVRAETAGQTGNGMVDWEALADPEVDMFYEGLGPPAAAMDRPERAQGPREGGGRPEEREAMRQEFEDRENPPPKNFLTLPMRQGRIQV